MLWTAGVEVLRIAGAVSVFALVACSAAEDQTVADKYPLYDAPVSGQGCEVVQLNAVADRLDSLPGIEAQMDLTSFQMQLDADSEYIVREYDEEKYVLRATQPVRIQSGEGSVAIACAPL